MKSLEIYEGIINTSEDGRGPSTSIGYFTHQHDATNAVKGKSSWGGDGTVNPKTITIYDSLKEYNNHVTDNIKKAALAKLSDIEKKALNL